MKKWAVMAALLVAAFQGWQQYQAGPQTREKPSSSDATVQPSAHTVPADRDEGRIAHAFRNQQSNVQVQGAGVVSRVLADDRDGSAHQRFIVRLSSGQSVLIAHNIDLASRVADLREGDSIEFYGEYEWNSQGGVLHWTHHDPSGRHLAGWLRHAGITYQ